MEQVELRQYLSRISPERGYGKCLTTRLMDKILPRFNNLTEFSKADRHAILDAYQKSLEMSGSLRNNGKVKMPFIGHKLYNLVSDAQTYIINKNLEDRKIIEVTAEKKRAEAAMELKRNPVFTVKALESVVALAKLAGAETVNLDKIFEVCDAFGVNLNEKEVA